MLVWTTHGVAFGFFFIPFEAWQLAKAIQTASYEDY